MRVALVHYWLTSRRGGEVVLEALGELLPEADLFAHVIDQDVLFGSLRGRRCEETFIARLPRGRRSFRAYLPLMPLALETLRLNRYDLIVSSESGPAKWVIPNPTARHICYCHTPMRYLWDQRDEYMGQVPRLVRPLAAACGSWLRQSDILSASRVDQFVANSHYVAQRIWRYYKREATVVYPPVDVRSYTVSSETDDYYLVAGEIVPYKRVDLAVKACTQLGRRLLVVGAGDQSSLKRIAGPTVQFLGRLAEAEFKQALAKCRALLFPGVEDFGLVPVEAMASGRPVIAFREGGATETVDHGVTGLHYHEQTVDGLVGAIEEFEANEEAFRPEECCRRAALFDRTVFLRQMGEILAVSP